METWSLWLGFFHASILFYWHRFDSCNLPCFCFRHGPGPRGDVLTARERGEKEGARNIAEKASSPEPKEAGESPADCPLHRRHRSPGLRAPPGQIWWGAQTPHPASFISIDPKGTFRTIWQVSSDVWGNLMHLNSDFCHIWWCDSGKDQSREIINLPFLHLTCKEELSVSLSLIYFKVKLKSEMKYLRPALILKPTLPCANV